MATIAVQQAQELDGVLCAVCVEVGDKKAGKAVAVIALPFMLRSVALCRHHAAWLSHELAQTVIRS